jgi:hypothetical protein
VYRKKASWENFEAAYNPHNALFRTDGRQVTLRMVGAEGIRLMAKEAQLYGLFSFKGLISDKPGVITAAYVSLGPWGGMLGM